MSDPGTLKLTPLGGVGRFGGNAMLFDTGSSAVVVDCGVRFLDFEEAPGFDFGLCDIDAIDAVRDRLHGYLLTHGHEDHVGALPFAYELAPAPIYATRFTQYRAKKAFTRAGAPFPDDVHTVAPGGAFEVGEFVITPFAVSHSIPDATALLLEGKGQRVIHSGDFRVDLDPLVGPPTDLEGLSRAGDAGIDLLVADSTSAGVPGHNPGERSVVEPLLAVVKAAPANVVVATYGSHIQRVAACAEVCRATGRKMRLAGRSLIEAVRAARDLNLLPLEDVLVSADAGLPEHRSLWVAAGCQGEQQGAFTRIAKGEHRQVKLGEGDVAIYSARIIPGNEKRVAAVFDRLAERRVTVVDGGGGRHVSGHGSSGDLEALLAAVRPRRFASIHGGGRQLASHRLLAERAGLGPDQVLPLVDGSSLALKGEEAVLREGGVLAERWTQGRHLVRNGPLLAEQRFRMARAGVLLLHVQRDGTVDLHAKALAPVLASEPATNFIRHRAAEVLARAPHDEAERTRQLASALRRRFGLAPEIWWIPACASDDQTEG